MSDNAEMLLHLNVLTDTNVNVGTAYIFITPILKLTKLLTFI